MFDKNFYYVVTKTTGDLPHLQKSEPTDPDLAWVKYVNNKPIEIKPYKDQDRVWDYSENRMYGLKSGVDSSLFEFGALPKFNGIIHEY